MLYRQPLRVQLLEVDSGSLVSPVLSSMYNAQTANGQKC